MSLDVEIRRSDSPIADHELDIDPAVASSVRPGPEKAVFNFKEYARHPGTRAAQNDVVYAAATLLHPAMRLARSKRNWTGALEPWVTIMEANVGKCG
jgi:hypothetical protein